jgi:serine/threonine protein kinase/tetratricopeptide (TPR) repeat protein
VTTLEETVQWQRIKELFDSALEREPGERDDFLSGACGSDTALRAEIESLLVAHAHAGAFSRGAIAINTPPELHEDDSVGPYRLIRRIGEGGMGEVWLADQKEPLQRQVALKLIRMGFFDGSLSQRFQAERQSLAKMEHPAIAKVFDAGLTPAGQPYLVIEYVPGEPITHYCDRNQLTIRGRLELFARVCDGVQHAHQKAVIHRDLKPGNILVIEVDGQPAPRIIDFGLASMVESGSDGGTVRADNVAGTPGYMSPEQLAGTDLDTRTDVYSLGVVLYELLTGTTPFDVKGRHHEPLSQLASCPKELPLTASTRRLSSEKVAEVAKCRHCSPRQLVRQLAGDPDLITAKALEMDRTHRYGTPLELASDIRRFLGRRPIEAHASGAGYVLQKYVLRHRVGVALALVFALLLVGAIALQTIALRRIARERDRAAWISDFMVRSFRVVDPSEARGNQVTAREILDGAYSQIDPGLAGDPEMQSQMMMLMGTVYENLGLYSRAEVLYRKAVAIRRQRLGPENTDTLRSQASLAWVLYRRGEYQDSEQLLRSVLAVRVRRFGENNADTITVMDYLGAVLNEQGHSTEAEKLERKVLSWRMRVDGPNSADTLVSMNHLSLALLNQGRWDEAERLDREEVAGWQRVEGKDSLRGLWASGNLAIVLYREGRLAEAESLDRQNLADKRRVLGPDHPETVRSMNTLTAVLTDERKLDEARSLAQEVIAIRTRVLGAEHPLTLSAMSNLAEILTRLGEYNRAQDLLLKAKALDTRVLGPNSPQTAMATYNLACVALRRDRAGEAVTLLQNAITHGLPKWIAAGMGKDPDLAALRHDSRFEALLDNASRSNAGAP